MQLLKILILLVTFTLQVITFCISANKFIRTTNKTERIQFVTIILSSLLGIVGFSNLAMYLI